MVKIFLIAGEHSGDALGGRLMAALGDRAECSGVGGPEMQAQGLKSFVPMEDLCVMGIFEVIKHYPRLRRLGFQIIEEIERTQPDVVVTIDLPDFNFKVAELLKRRGVFQGKIIHYVAPTVWAWRPGRAKKIAQFLDGLMCLFPFEPEYFTREGLEAEFVGHSLVESGVSEADGARFKEKHGIDKPTLGLFFGSRKREIETHGPVFQEVLERCQDMHVVVPTLAGLEEAVAPYLSGDYTIVTDDKWDAMAGCDKAVAVSGTVGLELAYLGVPHVIAYKMHSLSWMMVKMLVKTKYAHLANILLGREVVPEFLQARCTAENIAAALRDLSIQDVAKVRNLLGCSPSEKAAQFVVRNRPNL